MAKKKRFVGVSLAGGGGAHYNSLRVCRFEEDGDSSPLDEEILGPGRYKGAGAITNTLKGRRSGRWNCQNGDKVMRNDYGEEIV